MNLTLSAGPVDGRRLKIDGARLGDVLEIELSTGETVLYYVEEQYGKDLKARYTRLSTPDLPAAVIRIAEDDLVETWSYNFDTGGLERRETTRAVPTLSEILASLMLFGSLGMGLALLIVLVWLLGEFLHNWLGDWVTVTLWLSAVAGIAGTGHLIARPDVWRNR